MAAKVRKEPVFLLWKSLEYFGISTFCHTHFFIGYLFHLHFQCYPKSPPHAPPPTPTSWPCRSPVLRHIKFAWPIGLSFHWWPTRPSSDSYAARDKSSGGYWLVHIVVPPTRFPLAPWVLSLAPPWGSCDPSNSWLWASTPVFARPRHSLTRNNHICGFSANSC